MADDRTPRLAVLIDADNASARIVDRLFEEIATIGVANLRRIYGDFQGTRLKAWADVLQAHAIDAQQSFAYTTGKNASDIALVIDAMDQMHSGRFDGFCLVSSDSDFTRLASRIREQGIEVYGFGEAKTPPSFRQACTRFILTENLLPAVVAKPSEPDATEARVAPVKQSPSKAIPLIRTAIGQLDDADGWVRLGSIGNRLATLQSDFDSRTYGSAKLVDLVERTGAFDVRRENMHVHVREKTAAKPAAPAAPAATKPVAAKPAPASAPAKPAATPATAKPAAPAKRPALLNTSLVEPAAKPRKPAAKAVVKTPT